jgi:hypothetical protein
MDSRATERFWTLYNQLPDDIRQRTRKAYRLWKRDPNNRGLYFKPVHTRQSIYSVRIGLNYRALGVLDGNTIVWFWIGSHEEYDRLLKQL